MLIRRAVDADVATLFSLRAEVGDRATTSLDSSASSRSANSIVGMIQGSSDAGWIAFDGQQCLGFVMARAATGDVYLLLVHPNATRRGVGTALLAEAEHWLFLEGVRRAWLPVRGRAARNSTGFFRKRGWHTTGNEEDSRILYTKNLIRSARN